MRRTLVTAVALAVALCGCETTKGGAAGDTVALDAGGGDGGSSGGGADTGGGGSGGGGDASGAPDFDWPASQLALELADWGLSFTGALYDTPPKAFHTEAERNGLCRLLTYEPEVCEPSCQLPAVCAQGTCIAQSQAVSGGPVVLSGFAGGPITVEPETYGPYFWQTEDLHASDAAGPIGVKASGNIPFELQAEKVTAPTPDGDWSALLAARQPAADVTLTWSDPDPAARVHLRMTTGIGTHGGISPVEIECDGPDAGSLTLPGAWLDSLYAEGWSCGECGGNDLWRYRAAVSAGAKPVQFRVQAKASFWYRPGSQ